MDAMTPSPTLWALSTAAAQPAARVQLARGVNHVLVPAPLDPAANFARYGDAELPLERGVVTAVVDFLREALR